MTAFHILIFGEMAGFEIVPFIATHVKMKKKFHGAMKKKNSASQNSPICMKTTDIKLFAHTFGASIGIVPTEQNLERLVQKGDTWSVLRERMKRSAINILIFSLAKLVYRYTDWARLSVNKKPESCEIHSASQKNDSFLSYMIISTKSTDPLPFHVEHVYTHALIWKKMLVTVRMWF